MRTGTWGYAALKTDEFCGGANQLFERNDYGPEVLFDKICRENGITHRLTAPTTTGKIERFHRSLRTEFLRGKVFSDLAPAQGELDR